MRSDEHMTIGAVARQSGIPVRTLRFYEERRLIAPVGRTPKGYRLYGPAVLKELAFLKGSKRLGLHLDDIAELLQTRRLGKCPCGRTRALLASRLAETETALKELRTLRNEMRRTLRTWDEMPDGTRESPCHHVEAKLDDRA